MPGRVSTPSDPSLEPEDWQQIWRRLKKLCLVTQRANSRLIFVTVRPDDIFGDAVTFVSTKTIFIGRNDIQIYSLSLLLSRFQMSIVVRSLNLEFSGKHVFYILTRVNQKEEAKDQQDHRHRLTQEV